MLAVGCPRTPTLLPLVDRRLVLGEPGQPQVVLEADWRLDGDRFCARGAVDVITPAGAIRLYDADLCARPRPAWLSGEATAPIPAIGFLATLVTGQVPRGRLSLARGRELGALAIGREQLSVEPSHFYLTVDYAAPYEMRIGSASVASGAAPPRMIIDPHGPVFYLAGDLGGLLPAALSGVALGISPTGALPYTTAQPLFDGRTSAVRRVDGHLLVQGSFVLGDLPVTLTGRMVIDLDGNHDGVTALGGQAGDLVLAGDALARLRLAVGGLGLEVEIARASFLRDASATYLAGSVPATVFARTPLAAFEPRGEVAVRAVFRSSSDYAVLLHGDGRLLGLPFAAAEVEVGTAGVALRGQLDVAPLGVVAVAGAVGADASWSVAGRAPDMTVANVPLRDVQVMASPRASAITATTLFLGRPLRVTGWVTPDRQLALTGTLPISGGSRIDFALDSRGLRATFIGRVCAGPACVDIPAAEVDTQGNVCPLFPLVGRQCVKVL